MTIELTNDTIWYYCYKLNISLINLSITDKFISSYKNNKKRGLRDYWRERK